MRLAPRRHAALAFIVGVHVLAAASGCSSATTPPPEERIVVELAPRWDARDHLDYLFVVDVHASPAEQRRLADSLEALLARAAGWLTESRGRGSFRVSVVDGSLDGRGVLVTRGHAERAGCEAFYPAIHSLEVDLATPDELEAFARGVGCVIAEAASHPWGGQLFESTLAALTPGVWPRRQFPREHSTFSTVFVSNHDDCSLASIGGDDLARRVSVDPHGAVAWCALEAGAARVEVDAFVRAFQSRLGQMARGPDAREWVALVAGLPVEVDNLDGDFGGELDAWLDDPPRAVADPAAPDRLTPSCHPPTGSRDDAATPPTRLLQAIHGLDLYAHLHSICGPNGVEPFGVYRPYGIAGPHACLPSRVAMDADGRAACEVIAELPLGRRCDPDRFETRVEDDHWPGRPAHGRERCRVAQLLEGRRDGGWLLTDGRECLAGALWLEAFLVLDGTRLRVECVSQPRDLSARLAAGSPDASP